MAVNLSPVGGVAAQFFDNSGNVLTGGKIYTYSAGTTTPAATYTTSNGATPWSNPIVLDASGRVSGSGEVWLTDSIAYKFVLKDSNDVLIATYDNITGINSNFVNFVSESEIQIATAGQTVFNLTTMQYQPGTNNLLVFVDGVNQYEGSSYSFVETDENTVTFVSGLHVGAEVKFTTATPINTLTADAATTAYTPPFANSVTTNVEDKLAQTISVIDFGATGDGVTDDTTAIQNAINALPEGMWLDGLGLTYKITDQITVNTTYFRLRNFNFVFNTSYTTQGQFESTSTYVDLENISFDGGRNTYKVGNEPWATFATFNGYDSISPSLAPTIRVTNYSADVLVNLNQVNFNNLFADACVEIGTYGTVFINNCSYINIANKTFHVYHSPDNGVTEAGRTFANNVYAQDVGLMPATFTVGGVAKVRADAYAPQSSFNFIVSHGDFSINNATVWNYASCGVTADRNRSFSSDNVFIINDSAIAFSNNPSGAFWLEACNTSNISNLFVWITNRDSRDTALDSSALQLYCAGGSQTNINNLVILGSNSAAKIRKNIRGSVINNPSIYINNFYVYGLTTAMNNNVSFEMLPNSAIGHDIKLSQGYIRHGNITVNQPSNLMIDDVTMIGESSGGGVIIDVSGNPGITGTVGSIQVSNCLLNGNVDSTVNVTNVFKISSNKALGTISSSASSGIVSITDNSKIAGSIGVTGVSSSLGVCHVLNNGYIGGTTTLVRGKNGRVSGNTTQQRIEIQDVQTFEIVGNTAKTDQAEPIIWVNPATTANVLAGVISSNNVLIKTGTVGAGYVTIKAGVTGVTDVNNNKLTVAWS